MSRLVRILLALAVVFVVTARTEAAAEHCRRLAAAAEASAPVPQPEAAPCHGAHQAAASADAAHHPDQPGQDRCECMAVVTGYVSLPAAISSSRIEPYAWTRPTAADFASVDAAPDLRPPRT